MEDFVTWVDTSKLKRTIARYNDEVCGLSSGCERDAQLRCSLPSSLTISIFYDVALTSAAIQRTQLISSTSVVTALAGLVGRERRRRYPRLARVHGTAYRQRVGQGLVTSIIDFLSSLRSLLSSRWSFPEGQSKSCNSRDAEGPRRPQRKSN